MAIFKAIISCVDQLPALLCWCHGTPSFQMASTPMLCFIRNGMYTAGDPGITRASAHALSYHNAFSSLYAALSTEIYADGFFEVWAEGGGPHLCSLPACRIPIPSNFVVSFAKIETTVGNILDTNNIAYVEISIKICISQVCPECDNCNTSSQQFQIQHLEKTNAGNPFIFNGSTVEVIDLELEIEPACFPICFTGGIYKAWDVICWYILNQLDIFNWTGLECWRYGRCPDLMGNNPTIIIGIREDSPKLHHQHTQRIRGILAQLSRLISPFCL